MKMNEPVTRKLESHSFWQQANRIKIYSTLLKAEQREPFIFLDSQQRAKGALISGVARDFCPSVSFQCRLSCGVSASPCAIACINICAHVKKPPIYARVRWIMHTLKHPACTLGRVARLCSSWLSLGKATRISHRRNPHLFVRRPILHVHFLVQQGHRTPGVISGGWRKPSAVPGVSRSSTRTQSLTYRAMV